MRGGAVFCRQTSPSERPDSPNGVLQGFHRLSSSHSAAEHGAFVARGVSALSRGSLCEAVVAIQAASAAALAAVGVSGMHGRERLQGLQVKLRTLAAMHATVAALRALPEEAAGSALRRVQVREFASFILDSIIRNSVIRPLAGQQLYA
jgi:hypothetical protein